MSKLYYQKLWAEIQDEIRRNHYTGRVFSDDRLAGAVRDETELRARLGRRWREQIANLTGLCGAQHYLTAPLTELCEFPISVKSNGMLARFGTYQNSSKVLKLAREVGLVSCTNEYYSSGAGKAKCYVFNKAVEKLLMEIANKERIKPKMPVNYKKNRQQNSANPPVFLPSPIMPLPNGSTIHSESSAEGITMSCPCSPSPCPPLPNVSTIHSEPDNDKTESPVLLSILSPNSSTIQDRVHIGRSMLRGVTMEEVESALLLRYPQSPFFQWLADGLNEVYHHDKPEEQILFRPNIVFSRRGICTNIGIRATSAASGLPSREKAESEGRADNGDVKLWREDYLAELFSMPYEQLAHYDVKSSIYRTTYFLNTGEWLPQETDLYPLMYAGLRPDDPDGYEFVTAAQRAEYKQGCMRLYFCPSAADQLNKMRRAGLLSPYHTKEEQLADIEEARRKMRLAVGGRTYGSEVFLHESAVLLSLRRELYARGVQTSQCYDGFWSDDPQLPELCQELLPKVAAEYRPRWCC